MNPLSKAAAAVAIGASLGATGAGLALGFKVADYTPTALCVRKVNQAGDLLVFTQGDAVVKMPDGGTKSFTVPPIECPQSKETMATLSKLLEASASCLK